MKARIRVLALAATATVAAFGAAPLHAQTAPKQVNLGVAIPAATHAFHSASAGPTDSLCCCRTSGIRSSSFLLAAGHQRESRDRGGKSNFQFHVGVPQNLSSGE